jgi:hypothetical protein|tara:strand:- start:1036 stop:1263 length:228 start_codon:yes stop_codon:yes gene_type:complete
MESAELVDMMINGAKPSEVQDAVKDLLIMKAADQVDAMRPQVANSLFGAPEEEAPETESELETETETETETQEVE